MKNLLCLSKDEISIEDIDLPSISEGQVLIRTVVCGLCGSDIVKILDTGLEKPVKLGHEVVGIVEKVGKNIDKISAGDMVLVSHHIPCYECTYCHHGNYSMCDHFKDTNLFPQGFSEYIRLSTEHVRFNTFKIADKKMAKRAVFTEPTACCLRAVKRLRIENKDSALVIGSGTIGLIFISLFKNLFNAEVAAMDIDQSKLRMASGFGASVIFDPGKRDCIADLKKRFNKGVDIVELTFTNSQTVKTAFSAIRDGGQIQVFAGPSGKRSIEVDFEELYKREITLLSSYSTSPQELRESLDLIIEGRLDFSPLVSEILPIEKFKTGLEKALDRDSFKILFYFDKKLAKEYL